MDELKAIWAKNPPPAANFQKELERARHLKVSSSASRLRLRLGLETAAIVAIFAVIVFAWWHGLVYKSRTVLWMLGLAGASLLPVFVRLWRAVIGLSRPDYSKNILENLRLSIGQVRRELRAYLWSLYVFTFFMSVLVVVDPFVFWKKAAFVGVLLLNAFLGKYWVRALYGKELARLEAELEIWEKGE